MSNVIKDEREQDLIPGIVPDIECYRFSEGNWHKTSLAVPQEMTLTIYVNNQELVSTLCTPTKLNCLVTGYLFTENVISGTGDIVSMRICEDESLADVRLNKSDFTLPKRRILTSGCGGGISLASAEPQMVKSDLKLTAEQVLQLMEQLMKNAKLYRASGGIHTSALCDKENILVMAEDIGRHNTLDKIQGECLLRKMAVKDSVIITTGRLSSEMVRKAAKMGIAVIASLTSPTEQAIAIGNRSGVTIIGYAKGQRLSVYSCPERLIK